MKTDRSSLRADTVSAAPQPPSESASALRAKWGAALDAGFVALPNVLVTNFADLRITPTQFLVLTVLLSHWWTADAKPFPRVATIARRLSTTPRTVQRALNALRAAGLIDWERVQVLDRASSFLWGEVVERTRDVG